jgi:hypothetical protein
MKKRLNIDTISSELRGNSAFFPGYSGKGTDEPSAAAREEDVRPTDRPVDQPTGRRTDRAVARRIPVRRGFEFYEDQLVTLKKLSLQEQMDGKPGSMSQMVREALDDYLKKRGTKTS